MRTEKKTSLVGVDLGGTNVRAGLVQNGRIIAFEARPHPPKANAEAIIDEICQTIAKVLRPGVSGIGVGVPTLVNKGIVYSPNNIPSWKVVPLQKILERRFHVPVVLNNDAKCFALGELHFGAGRGCKNLVGLIVGTGLGAGVIINGKLYSGSNGGAGEIGSIAYKEKDFEHYCSGRFFQCEFGLDGATLHERAKNGDRKAQAMFAAFGDDFANVIMALLYAYDPEIIVLGGSVSKAYPYFEGRMREKLKAFHFQNSLKRLKIVQSKKANIAVLAAASLCLDNQ
ncbi:MAG: ROK family protein [Verrucomicrobiota bacterium]|jgi:glucokinase